jgi:PA14 domain
MKHFGTLKHFLLAIITLTALVACGQTATPDQTDPSQDDPRATATNGLTGVYYDNMDFTGITKTRVDTTINKAWAKNAPITGIAASTYSVRWTGQIVPAFSETYTFYLTSSDGARLMVNGQVLVNNWTDHTSTVNSGTVTLQANTKYDIRLEYYRNVTNSSVVKLEWQSANRARQVVPTGNLFPTLSNAQNVITTLNANSKFTALGIILDSSTSRIKLNTDGSLDSLMQISTGNGFVISKTNSGNVLSLQYFLKVGNLGSLTDVLSSRSVSIDSLSSYINSDGTATDAQRQALAIKLVDFFSEGRVSVSATTVNVTQGIDSRRSPRYLEYVPGLCKIFLPPSDCANHSCIKLAEGYRDAVCGVAFAGSEIIIGLLSGLVVGPAQIAVKIFTNTFGGAAAIDLIARIMSLQPAWEAYLDCISGKVPVLMPDGITISHGCPPILEGPNPNPINITNDLGYEGFVAVRWGNKAPVGSGPLAYGYQLQGQGLGISVSLSATSLSVISPFQSGTVKAGGFTGVYIWYKCSQIPSIWIGTFTLSHNALNAASPLPVPVTINCIQGIPQINVAPNPISFTTSLNSSVTKSLTITNPGTGYLEISGFGITVPWLTASPSGFTGANAIAANSSQNVSVTASCGAIAESRTGTIGVFHNVPGVANPYLVTVNLICFAKAQIQVTATNTFVSRLPGEYTDIFANIKIANVGDPGSSLNYRVAQIQRLIGEGGIVFPFNSSGPIAGSLAKNDPPIKFDGRAYCYKAGFYQNDVARISYETGERDANNVAIKAETTVNIGIECLRAQIPGMTWGAAPSGLGADTEGYVTNFGELNRWIGQNCGSGFSEFPNPLGSLAQLDGSGITAFVFHGRDVNNVEFFEASGSINYRTYNAAQGTEFQHFNTPHVRASSSEAAFASVTQQLSQAWLGSVGSLCATIRQTR